MRLVSAVIAIGLVAGCGQNSAPIVIGPQQQALEQSRHSKYASYTATDNEMQQSALFSAANTAMEAALTQAGHFAKGWTGKLEEVSTSYGGSGTRITIRSESNNTYSSYKDISGSSAVYHQLSSLKTGQLVTFSGAFVPHDEERYEWSLTERGSLEEPEFKLIFTSVVPYGAPEASAAHVMPPASAFPSVEEKPAAPAQPKPARTVSPKHLNEEQKTVVQKSFNNCLLGRAKTGKFSSLDGGHSAMRMMMDCENEWYDYLDMCVGDNGDEGSCTVNSAILAQAALKLTGR